MVSRKVMESVNTILQHLHDNRAPFDSIQMVCVSDFHQLPPVPSGNDDGKYAFMIPNFQEIFSHVFLETGSDGVDTSAPGKNGLLWRMTNRVKKIMKECGLLYQCDLCEVTLFRLDMRLHCLFKHGQNKNQKELPAEQLSGILTESLLKGFILNGDPRVKTLPKAVRKTRGRKKLRQSDNSSSWDEETFVKVRKVQEDVFKKEEPKDVPERMPEEAAEKNPDELMKDLFGSDSDDDTIIYDWDEVPDAVEPVVVSVVVPEESVPAKSDRVELIPEVGKVQEVPEESIPEQPIVKGSQVVPEEPVPVKLGELEIIPDEGKAKVVLEESVPEKPDVVKSPVVPEESVPEQPKVEKSPVVLEESVPGKPDVAKSPIVPEESLPEQAEAMEFAEASVEQIPERLGYAEELITIDEVGPTHDAMRIWALESELESTKRKLKRAREEILEWKDRVARRDREIREMRDHRSRTDVRHSDKSRDGRGRKEHRSRSPRRPRSGKDERPVFRDMRPTPEREWDRHHQSFRPEDW